MVKLLQPQTFLTTRKRITLTNKSDTDSGVIVQCYFPLSIIKSKQNNSATLERKTTGQ